MKAVSELAHGDFGVLGLLGPTGVALADGVSGRSLRFLPDPAVAALLGLVSVARERQLNLAVACPPTGRHLPLLLVAATALAQTIEHFRQGESAVRRGILLVSTDLEVRSRYCDLYVGTEQIERAHPGSRLRPTGDRVPLTSGRDISATAGVCFYLPRGPLPEKVDFRPALILLDFRYARTRSNRVAELVEWAKRVHGTAGVVALHSCGDAETAERLQRAQYQSFALDHRAIRTCGEFVAGGQSMTSEAGLELTLAEAPVFLDRLHKVLEVPHAEHVEQIEQQFTQIGEMLDGQSQVESADLNRARWLLATLRQLPVPLDWYEQTAFGIGRQTLRNLIDRIGVLSRYDRLGAVLQSLRVQFDVLYRLLKSENPRVTVLRRELPRLEAPEGSTLVLVRDRVTERALRTWIDLEAFHGAEWVRRLDIRSCPEFASAGRIRYQRALVCGVLPRRHRWIAGAALADETTFLTYPHETDVVEQQLRPFYEPAMLERAAQQRSDTVARARGDVPPANALRGECVPIAMRLQRPPKKKVRPTPVSATRAGGLTDLASLVAEAERRAADSAAAEQLGLQASWRANDGDAESVEDIATWSTDAAGGGDVMAYRVGVRSSARGDGYIWLPEHVAVECVSPKRPNELGLAPPADLEPGDVVLRLEEGGRADLFDKIVELAENQPQLSFLARFRREWRDALERVAVQHRRRYGEQYSVDYATILSKLQGHGATIQSTLTVRNWIENYVIGPDDVSSIVAVGCVAETEAVARNAKEFDRAFRRIRGIHQGIGRRLSTAIRQQFKTFAAGGADDSSGSPLDIHLGLPLDELLESVEFLQVLSLSETPSAVSPDSLSRFAQE